MSLLRSFRNLSPRTRIGVGVALLAWGAIGLQLSDRAEARYGFTPTDEDKAALAKMLPSITAVDREGERSSSSSSSADPQRRNQR